MNTKKKNFIPKSNIELKNVNTIIADNIIYYDIENKGLLNLIKFKEKSKSKKNYNNNTYIKKW